MLGSHHFVHRVPSPLAKSAGSGEDPREHWRLTTSPDESWKTGTGCGCEPGRADLSDLRLPGPPPAPSLGGGLRVLWREAMAVRGGRADPVCLRALPGDLAGEAGGS